MDVDFVGESCVGIKDRSLDLRHRFGFLWWIANLEVGGYVVERITARRGPKVCARRGGRRIVGPRVGG